MVENTKIEGKCGEPLVIAVFHCTVQRTVIVVDGGVVHIAPAVYHTKIVVHADMCVEVLYVRKQCGCLEA